MKDFSKEINELMKSWELSRTYQEDIVGGHSR